MRQSATISLRSNREPGCFQVSAKFPDDGTKSRQVDLLKVSARGTELFKQAEKMIRSAPDRNRSEPLGFPKRSVSEKLFRGQGEQEAEMFARWRCAIAFPRDQRAKIWGREELQTERGKTRGEQASFEGLDLAAGRNNDNGRTFALPRLYCGLLEPVECGLLPRRFRRLRDEQRMSARRLKLEFQLHRLILAEGVDNRCPRVKQIPVRCTARHRVLPSPLRA